jgi:NADH-quinone oxidoreductase subunit L
MTTSQLALALLLFPAGGAIILAGRGWRLPRIATKIVGPGVVWASFVATLVLFFNQASGDFTYWSWIKSGSFEVPFNLLIDNLSLFMCLVITGVGGLIVTYSVGYMEHEDNPSYARFFTYMDVFIFSMLLLVLAGNFVFLIVGWALVGLSSYFLIGFWYQRRSAVLAARKAFVMNVIGDVGMILGAIVIFVTYHSTTYLHVFGAMYAVNCPNPARSCAAFIADSPNLELAAFLLLVGAVAKSAQLPLHTWLPDAMEGPTPVSALIHAATMVTAGVYLVGRMHPIYDVAVYAHGAVAIVGAVTALFAASIAMVQTDIKRVLAYSTMSQIGYMFLAVGIGAYTAGFFHLLSHAFFKALLFMAAGNVIHAMHDEQDMRKYGGLWGQMRPTSISFLVGCLSLVGVIPFVGFFSKEEILGAAFSRPGHLGLTVWAIGFVTALITGFYTGRMWWLAFWGRPSPDRPVEHPHEAPPVMLFPVGVLAGLATVGGLIETRALGFGPSGVTDFLSKAAIPQQLWEGGGAEVAAAFVTMILAAALFVAARQMRPWTAVVPWAQRLLERKYYFDEIYDAAFVRPMDAIASLGFSDVETVVIDGVVTGTGEATEASAGNLSYTQSGFFRNYVLVFVAGAVVVAVLLLARSGT